MPWSLWSSQSSSARDGNDSHSSPEHNGTPSTTASHVKDEALHLLATAEKKAAVSWNESLNATDWEHFKEPRNWVPTLLVTATALGLLQFYRSYLRRIPGTNYITPGYFRRRSLLGRVTSVGDGDNFHLFHTPGGRLAGWGWLRKVPKDKKEVRGRTIPVRIAGIDAPEGAHFGRPAQPHSGEALAFLREYLQGRRVRAYIYRRDQYERVVASVLVRQPPFFFPRRDVGLEMLKRGLATTYVAKTGAEFGGEAGEKRYKAAEEEARRKGRGLWAAEKGGLFGLRKKEIESPRMYKDRMKAEGKNS